ncbi:MAG: hypothetical protein RCO49_00555 [Rickettsia endosymbiont of Argas persicus]
MLLSHREHVFHGLAVTPILKKYGVESKHLVWDKDTNNPDVLTFQRDQKIHEFITNLETKLSLQSMLYRNALQMIKMPEFQEADLVHLHIIHTGYLSIGDLPKITKLKPTVWTLHDPWALTGHCVHPFGLDLQFFSPEVSTDFREKYNIQKESLVICFRGDMDNLYKGVSYIVSALEKVKTDQPITLLICGFSKNYAALENFANRFQVIKFMLGK